MQRLVLAGIALNLDDADVELTQCSGNKFQFRLDDGDIRMDGGKGRLEIDGDDSDIDIRNADFSSIDANVDDGDLVIETSLTDNGEYMIDAQDGLIAFTVIKGGGKFDIRHDDGHISTQGDFNTVEDYEAMETQREQRIKEGDFTPNFDMVQGLYDKAYKGKGLLIYIGSKGFYREYDFS